MPQAMAQALLALARAIQSADVALFSRVNRGCASPILDPVMVLFTELGLGTVQLALLVLLCTFGGPAGRRVAGLCLFAFLVSGVAAQILKEVADRPRPTVIVPDHRLLIEMLRYNSFPSGHTATSFAIAVVAGACYRRWRIPLLLAAALVGVSRVYVGVHFPSDVLAGALLGVATGIACLHDAPPAYKPLDNPPEGSGSAP